MDPRRFARVKGLFDRAASLHGTALAAFLETLDADDPQVRREVQRLLQQKTRDAGLSRIRSRVRRATTVAADAGREVRSGDTLAHYRLERRLGSGGMGDVWLADDLALGRPAAIKLLRPGLDARYRDRLLREAWATARLQHPAIAMFYESGETEEGVAYLAMEYVAGTTLRARLGRGPLPPRSALDVTSALLEGLIHAHETGILHRDIKPENIVLTDEGAAKLLDFGLARTLEQGESTSAEDRPTMLTLTALTAHGAIAGTVGYMAPEQLRGEPVDVRTDVFAMGAVLHEILTGRPAFPGKTLSERMAAVLSRDPDPVSGVGIPAGVGSVLNRALARDREERYPDAVEMLRDLRRVREGEAIGILPDTLAILDLRNLSGDPDDDWIGTGVAESLAADLGRVPGLSVVPLDKVARAAAQRRHDPRETGLALGCRWALDGTVRKVGDAIRITTVLRDVATGDVVATEKADGRQDELFALEDKLSEAVTASLHLEAASETTTPDLDAFEEYSRARREWRTFEKGAMDRGRERMERALEADPGYVPALSGLAGYHAMQFNARGDATALDRAMEYAQRALAIRPDDTEARVWSGYVHWRQGRPERALRDFREAESLDPGAFMASYFIGAVLVATGEDPQRAIGPLQRSVRFNPGFSFNMAILGGAHVYAGNSHEALWILRQASVAEKQGAPSLHGSVWLAEALRVFGDPGQAESVIRDVIARVEKSDHMLRDMVRAQSLCELARITLADGRKDTARTALHQARLHLEGRAHAVGAGLMLVSALALQGACRDERAYREAERLLRERDDYDFSWSGITSDGTCRTDLGRAALALGLRTEAREWLESVAPCRHEARAMLEGMDAAGVDGTEKGGDPCDS